MGLLPQLLPKDVLLLNCPLCQFHSHLLNKIETHFDEQHPDCSIDFVIYRCNICQKVASCKLFMKEHIQLFHEETTDQLDSAAISVYFSGQLHSKTVLKNGLAKQTLLSKSKLLLDSIDTSTNSSVHRCVFCHSEYLTFEQLQTHYISHGIRNLTKSELETELYDEDNNTTEDDERASVSTTDIKSDETKRKSPNLAAVGKQRIHHNLTTAAISKSLNFPGNCNGINNTCPSIDELSPLKSLAGQISTNLQSRSSLFNLIMQQQQQQQALHSPNDSHPLHHINNLCSQTNNSNNINNAGSNQNGNNSNSSTNSTNSSSSSAQGLSSIPSSCNTPASIIDHNNICSVGLSQLFPIAGQVPPLAPRINGSASWFTNLGPQLITSPILSSLHSHFAGSVNNNNTTSNNDNNISCTINNNNNVIQQQSGTTVNNCIPNLHQQMMQAYAAVAANLPHSLADNCTSPCINQQNPSQHNNCSTTSPGGSSTSTTTCTTTAAANNNIICNNINNSTELFQIPKGFPSVFSSVINNINQTLTASQQQLQINNNNINSTTCSYNTNANNNQSMCDNSNNALCTTNNTSLDLSTNSTTSNCHLINTNHNNTNTHFHNDSLSNKIKVEKTTTSSSESDRSSISLSPSEKYLQQQQQQQQQQQLVDSTNNVVPTSEPNSGSLDDSHMYSMKRVVGLSRTNLPFTARKILFGWLTSHLREPYPSEEEKIRLANETGLSRTTVNNWFINARRRYVKPLLQGRLGMTSGVLKSMLENNTGSVNSPVNSNGLLPVASTNMLMSSPNSMGVATGANPLATSQHNSSSQSIGGSGGGGIKRKVHDLAALANPQSDDQIINSLPKKRNNKQNHNNHNTILSGVSSNNKCPIQQLNSFDHRNNNIVCDTNNNTKSPQLQDTISTTQLSNNNNNISSSNNGIHDNSNNSNSDNIKTEVNNNNSTTTTINLSTSTVVAS